MTAGHGGVTAVSEVTGIARSTINRGRAEIESGADCGSAWVRRAGGGRRKLSQRDPALVDDLKALLEPATRGDPRATLGCGLRRAWVIWRRRLARWATG